MTRLALYDVSGLLKDMIDKLSGEDCDQWREALRRLLRKENPWPEFGGVWKTIKLGTGLKNADDFRKAIKDCGMEIGDWANDIIGKPEFAVITKETEETEVDLVKITVAELGFKDGAQRDQIYGRAKELGLELCPSEVGPQLRLQYKDQPLGEWILIAMKPIRGSDGDLNVFNVEHNDSGLWLNSNYGNPGNFWNADNQWVFVRPRNFLCFSGPVSAGLVSISNF